MRVRAKPWPQAVLPKMGGEAGKLSCRVPQCCSDYAVQECMNGNEDVIGDCMGLLHRDPFLL